MKKALCVGHAAYDITLTVPNFPKENTKVRIGESVECGGGAAANAAYLLAKWGMDTSFAGAVGNDLYGEKIQEEFRQIGVDMTYLEVTDAFRTTTSYVLANQENGSRTIVVSRSKEQGSNIPNIDKPFDVILVDGEEENLSREVLLQNPEAISVIDAGNLKKPIVALCPLVKYLVCSQDFAEEYTNQKIDLDKIESVIPIYEQLVCDFQNTVVITLGSKGSFTKTDQYYLIPGLSVKAVDSTAAGDIYHGAFTYFISNGYSLLESMKLANIAGALSVTKVGGKNSMPELEEVLKLGNQNVS